MQIANVEFCHAKYFYKFKLSKLPHPTQLNLKLGKPYFPKKFTNHKPKPSFTFSHLLHNQTRSNSVFNIITTQLEDSCKKNVHHP